LKFSIDLYKQTDQTNTDMNIDKEQQQKK